MSSPIRQFPVSAAFVKHHLSAYVGAAVLLGVATVIATAEMVLYTGLASGQAVDWTQFSEFDERVVRSSLTASRGILQVMCFTTVAVALVLVFLGFRNMLALRRRELGQMRLAGASVLRIRGMIALEALIFATVIVVPAVLLGQLLAHPFYLLLQSIGVFGRSLHVNLGFPVGTLLAVAAGMVLCSIIAAWFSLRGRQKANVLDALEGNQTGKTARRMGAVRIVIAALSVAGLVGFLIFMPDTGSENPVASLLVPLLIVFPLGALAPLIVPAVAGIVSWALRPIIRGSGVLVAQRAYRDARRFASNVLPVLILVGVMGGFSIGSGPDQATMQADYDTQITADLVSLPETSEQADAVADAAEEQGGVTGVMRSASTTRLIEVGRPDGTFLTVFNFVDLANYTDMFVSEPTSGSFADVGGKRIVSTRETDEVGDIIDVEAPGGQTVQLEVGAVVSSRIYTDLLVDWSVLEELDPQVWDTRVFLTTDAGQTDAVAEALSDTAPILTKAQFVQTRVEQRQESASSGNIALFGTVYALAIVAMIQGLAASTLNRRSEYRMLNLLGISRPRIITTLLSEAIVLLATSAVLLTAAFAFIAWRYLSQAGDAVATAIAAIPWGEIALTFGAMSVLFISTVFVSALIATRKLTSNG
ncbi:ABC transporter permease [Brevibacterium sp. 50QC2O2]|uniref:FtsX-like permease family protein n=1 Tax=unclassified Brevibacterium TaxID=2614124 RepID=UPI00211D136A|nr:MULTISPECIES: ABC transporter permease [unclassified Brevibacterium]MCQ9367594.1 ABC transporter permease [Brevibacterium sp. 91QC2O2]MCQ9389046.1 ABC transporter permease [Brevibacterium sp. 50QC2O2]